ncbi:HDIG domain-containing protein, partial [bacterium]|nr:HDIG domain-containing protein [bacterium]
IRNLKNGETSNINNFDEFFDIQEARNSVNDVAKEYFLTDETGKKKNLIIMLGQKLIKPTVSENKLEYEKRKLDISANMSPVLFSLKKGEIISRAGDRVTGHQVDRINSYFEKASNVDKLPKLAGVILFALFSTTLISFSFQFPDKKIRLNFRNLLLIMTSVLISLVLVKGGVVIGDIISSRYLEVQPGIYHYILPVAFGSMLVGILLNFEAALMTGLLTSLFSSIMMQGSLYYFFYAIMGGVVASLPMTKFDSRYSILLHGLKISAVNLPMMAIIYLIESSYIGVINWLSITCAVFGGILTAILVSIILPFFESIFDITTNLKLLELSNMNHPALKKLIFHAPGTYQHSIIVGNLAESGAVEIGANPLLSRVAAYYHDIGKANDSHYYIENQTTGFINIHDSMDPYESAKVIVDHIRKGAEMAEKFRLGKVIIEILLQHHGTNLVKYFYNKAEEQVDESEKSNINENNFRYKGPKPQSLEAALVMLADVSEASSRSLNKPTPERIREIVEKVCWDILADGQLDESGLTLRTYHTVVDIYCAMLTSIHHHRVSYPDAKP